MTNQRIKLGKYGENVALQYLIRLGMTLVHKNYRIKTGEIDLIMMSDDVLVFVEVRTKSNDHYGTPVETIDYGKRRKIEKTARHFLKSRNISDEVRCRFDLVGVLVSQDENVEIDYVQNAFFIGE